MLIKIATAASLMLAGSLPAQTNTWYGKWTPCKHVSNIVCSTPEYPAISVFAAKTAQTSYDLMLVSQVSGSFWLIVSPGMRKQFIGLFGLDYPIVVASRLNWRKNRATPKPFPHERVLIVGSIPYTSLKYYAQAFAISSNGPGLFWSRVLEIIEP